MKNSLLWASVAVATIGLLFYNVMPLYLGQLQESTGLTTGQIGFVASAFFFGFNLISFSSYYWVRKVPVLWTSLAGTLLLIVCLLATGYADGFTFQVFITAIIGSVSGAVSSIGITIAGDADNNTRWYGIQVAAEAAAGVALLFLLPVTLIPIYGFQGLIYGMILLMLVILPSYWYLTRTVHVSPKYKETESIGKSDHAIQTNIHAIMGLIAMAFLFVGSAAVWAFVERIAAINEFDPEAVGSLLGISLFFSVLGSLIAGALGNRYGNLRPYLFNCLLLVAGVITIAVTDDLLIYAVGACLFMLGWAAAFAFLFAIIADVDPDGNYISLSVPALGVGSMIGPGMAGLLLSGGSTLPLLTMCLGTVAVSMIFSWLGGRGAESPARQT